MMNDYTQAVQWPGTLVNEGDERDFEAFIAEQFGGVRAKFLFTAPTRPDMDVYGDPIPETGGRVDAYFLVHNDDLAKFAVPRLGAGMRWVEDVILNENYRNERTIYEDRVHELWSWPNDPRETAEEVMNDLR